MQDEHSELLLFQDTLRIRNELPALSAGSRTLGFMLKYAGEQRPDDNCFFIQINIETVENPLVINEILYSPQPGFPEWIELLNRGQYDLNINQWKFADARDTVTISAGSPLVEPGEYYLLAKDSAVIMQYAIPAERCFIVPGFPTLNNDGDDLKLLGLSGRLIDRVTYSSSWMEDGYEDFTLLQYKLPLQTGFITVDIFDLLGRRVRRLADYVPVGQQGSLLWDGKDGNGKVCRMGMYVVLTQVFGSGSKLYKQFKNTVVLVKK
ncbi:hypothetical protein B1H10_05330 [candidate division KSB1 bacterium 4484_188]|nr:MAG: hypothetical protein B1H10_05330 [candidate division KSB1 bacterium 4484_188]